MSLVQVRKYTLGIEEVFYEGGPRLQQPLRVAVAVAIVKNPYAGRYEEDLLPFTAELRSVGTELSNRLLAALGGVTAIQAYGKGASGRRGR